MLLQTAVLDSEDVDQHPVVADLLANDELAVADDVHLESAVGGEIAGQRGRGMTSVKNLLTPSRPWPASGLCWM